eukprot:5276057-Lingulodinium_polyedra.AAC.1
MKGRYYNPNTGNISNLYQRRAEISKNLDSNRIVRDATHAVHAIVERMNQQRPVEDALRT